MKNIIIYITPIFLLLIQVDLYAQDDLCSQNLEEAQLRYDEGRIQDIEGLVLRCIEGGTYDKAQSVQALRLLILSYIFRGEEGKADTTMLRLLQKQHEFVPDQALDPVEFINLHATYRTKPIFKVGIKGGINMSFVEPTKLYTTGQPGDPGEFEYSPKQGVTIGVIFEYEFAPRWNIYPEFLYSNRTFDNAEEFSALTEISTDPVDKKEETERQVWLELPISVQYRFTDGPVRPYVNLGGSLSYLNYAELPANDNQLSRQNNIIQNTLGDITDDRNQLNFYAFLGGGVKVKVSEGYIVAELRANYGLNEVSTGEFSFSPTGGQASKGQVPERIIPDAYKKHFATFTIGYTLNIYKMKKL
jgi:hypothetical protein